ncbi:glutathione S-transferase family protein [Roseateles toxinivorans]|uniref:glutathione transferase n=1 Tax=Roseateles toxinivorans TaxID=270368 RepID=A0A4R6QI93_9BURK|nr:glutathione S-transferase family protein [Roseateles toxinivorans]TDP61342.1 glutathione S-transferase [Roseateles toxinivorans]
MSHLELISHKLCPYVQRAVIALSEKNLPFTRTDIDLAAKPAWFKALSPLGKVPLLRIGDEVLFESAVIVEYLEDTQAPALHPADALQRARHRAWIEFGSTVLNDIWGFYTAADVTQLQAKRELLRTRFERLEEALDTGPYFAGERFSLVDAVFAPVFRYWELFDRIADFGVFDGLPRVQAWRRALTQRPSVQGAVAEDYVERLSNFVRAQHGELARLMADMPAAEPA